MEKRPIVSFGILVTSIGILLLVLPLASAQFADTLLRTSRGGNVRRGRQGSTILQMGFRCIGLG